MEIRELIEKIIKAREAVGGIKCVVWVAAGGSHDGHYAAQYFICLLYTSDAADDRAIV